MSNYVYNYIKNNNIVSEYNSYLDTTSPNDIILQCQEVCFRVNYNVGIANSKLLYAWSKKMRSSGFTVDLNDCNRKAIEFVLKLFKDNDIHIPQALFLDIYRVLVKLECQLLEKKFYNYINESILMRCDNNNNFPNSKCSDIKKDNSLTLELKEHLLEVKSLHKIISDFIDRKKFKIQCEKKSLKELPDVIMSDKVINAKFLTGKKVLNYRNYQEIFDILDFYKLQTSYEKMNIPSPEYNNFKLIIDNEVYEIKCLMDLKDAAKYIKRIYNKYEKKSVFNNDNSIKTKHTPLKNFTKIIPKKNNQSKLLNNKKNSFKSFNKGKCFNKKDKSATNKSNVVQNENFEEQLISRYLDSQTNTIHRTIFYEKPNIYNAQENKNKANVEFNRSYYILSTQISTDSDYQLKTSLYSDSNEMASKNFCPKMNYHKKK